MQGRAGQLTDRPRRLGPAHSDVTAGGGRAGQDRAGQGRAGQDRAGQGRAGQGRAGQGRAEIGRGGWDRLTAMSLPRGGRAGQGKSTNQNQTTS